MSSTYQELIAQREALDRAIEEARRQELKAAIGQVKQIIAQYALTERDVFGGSVGSEKKSAKQGMKVLPKYRDSSTGQTWTGRGKPPVWIAGKDRTPFLIK
jgi:DNA-binding protein H-NS